MSTADKRQQAVKTYPVLSLSKRCKILGVSRSTIYYKPKGKSALNEVLMREIDNIYIEHFWRSIKYEKIYLNPPNGGVDLRNHVHEYITFYNTERRHTEIGKVPPDELYFKKKVAS